MYSLLEAFAKAADDPYLGVTIGESLDLSSWPALAEASLLGDFINRFIIAVEKHANSVSWGMRVSGNRVLSR